MKKIDLFLVNHAILTIIAVFILIVQASFAKAEGVMILSNTNQGLAINAYGGAQHGAELKLVDNCVPSNSDCTWTLREGMIVSDTNQGLAINAYGGAGHGTVLKLVNNCTPSNSDCTWTLRDGMIVSNTNHGLAINAYGGAGHGTVLKLVNNCAPSNSDCTWVQRKNTNSSLETGPVYTDLSGDRHMWTKVKLNKSNGNLQAETRTQMRALFWGFKGGVQVAFVDNDDFIIFKTNAQRYGVDGTWIGRSDRTDSWSEIIPPEVIASTKYMVVVHYWADNFDENLDNFLSKGKKVGAAIAEIIKFFNGNNGKAGSGS